MRQVFLSKSGQILVEEAPAPDPGPGEALIDVAFSLISTGTETSSVATAKADLRERITRAVRLAKLGAQRLQERGLEETLRKARVREGISAPMGYSVAGIVRAVGGEIADLAPGQRVAAAGSAYAHHAEVVAVPRNLVVPVPEEVALRDASFATVGAIALQGVRRAMPQVGETAVVIGLGLVGQLTVQILAAAGCRVIGVDPRSDRVDLARGGPGGLVAGSGPDVAEVERVVAEATGGLGADVVLLCAGTASSDPANTALRVVRQRGRVVVVGAVGMELAREPFYRKEVEFTISCSYGPGRYDPTYEEGGIDYPAGFVRWTENRNLAGFLDLVARRRVDPASLLAAEHEIGEAAEAFRKAKEQIGSGVAVVLRYPAGTDRGQRTVTRRPVPSRQAGKGPVGVAVIGAGGFAASTLLPAIRALEGFALRTVVTRSSASAARVAQEFDAAQASTDAAAALADPSVEAVVIATRHDLHAPLALEALAAGKHVFLEKPMGLSREQIDGLRDAARASDRIFTVGYNRRYAPLVLRARDALRAAGGCAVADYRVNAGFTPPGHWTLDPNVGGGRIVGEACHMLDLLAFLLGPEVLSFGCEAIPSSDPSAPSPQDFAVSLRFRDPGGSVNLASLLYTARGGKDLPKERIEIHAGRGSLVLDDFSRLSSYGLSAKDSELRRPDKGHRDEMRLFLEAIEGRKSVLLGVDEAWQAADLALRIDAALRGRLERKASAGALHASSSNSEDGVVPPAY